MFPAYGTAGAFSCSSSLRIFSCAILASPQMPVATSTRPPVENWKANSYWSTVFYVTVEKGGNGDSEPEAWARDRYDKLKVVVEELNPISASTQKG